MIDMHCHILPGIDDGAQTVEDSLALLRAEKEQEIKKIVFTPHFNPERQDMDMFLEAREKSWEALRQADGFSDIGIDTKLGCEVFFTMRLIEMDISKLAFENTRYILIEFPTINRPYGITRTMQNILGRGYTPILAHVERYEYFTDDPVKLYDLVSLGCIAQVNAAAVVNTSHIRGVNAMQYINWELAHIISSDAHSVDRRPPNTKAAYRLVEKKLGSQYKDWLIKNTRDIFNNRYFDDPIIQKPKKLLGRWR